MPDTRPGIKFDEKGICYACLSAEKKKTIDWEVRWKELEEFCDKYRGWNGDGYDCIIAASSGKDSHFQIHILKEKLGMNPLIVSIDNSTWTQTGRHNWTNLLTTFGVDAHILALNPRVNKKMSRLALEYLGSPNWYWDKAVYAYPLQIAVKLGIPLIIYGENINYEYGGGQIKETPSAIEQINNDVVKPVDWNFWIEKDPSLSMKDFNPCIYPTKSQIKKAGLEPVYLSYFMPWSGYKNMEFARTRGFKTLDDTGEWKRQGFIEQYDQIDTIGYLVHSWFKFIKFGHFRVTDIGSIWIREGRLTREEAVKLVNEEDYKLDSKMLKDFLDSIGYSEQEFWEIVEKFANKEIIEKVDGVWRLKKPCQ
jgi:N-acetyl sugar amidotransferase